MTILTGFLGSGKTTLLNWALKSPAMSRAAVIINEFGEIPIDHALTATSDDNIMVLENGCLCCTVFGDLVGTLNRLYHAREAGEIAPFNHVLIETSGLADPTPVLQAFLSEPTLEGLYRAASVVATLDAVNGPDTLTEHEESIRQIALADKIVVTKLDLGSEDRKQTQSRLSGMLRRFNPAAEIHAADEPGFDPVAVLCTFGFDPAFGGDATTRWLNLLGHAPQDASCSHNNVDGDHRHHDHPHHTDIATFALVRDTPLPRQALQLLLSGIEQNLGSRLLRVKGLVNVLEEPGRPAVLQGAQHLLHNLTWLERWPDQDERTRIVFITYGMPTGELQEMVQMLDRIAFRTSEARRKAQQSLPAEEG